MGDVTDINSRRAKKHASINPMFIAKIGDEILKLNGLYVGAAIGLYVIKAAAVQAGMKEGDELDTTFRWLGEALEKRLNTGK